METRYQKNFITGKGYYIIIDSSGCDIDAGPFETLEEAEQYKLTHC